MKTETTMMPTITITLAVALVVGSIVLPAADAIQLLQDADNNTLEQIHHKAKHIKKNKQNH